MDIPKKTRILINNNDEGLEFIFSLPGFRHQMTIVGIIFLLIISFPIGLSAYAVYASELPYKIIAGLFSIPFLAVGAALIFISIGSFFNKPYILIDSEKIIFTHKFFNKDSNTPRTFYRQDIDKFEYSKGRPDLLNSKFYSWSFNYLGTILCKPNLIIYTNLKEYNIRYFTNYAYDFSEAELDWLADEISNRLELPITREEVE